MEFVLLIFILGYFIDISEGSVTLTAPTAGNCGDDTVLTCHITGNIGSTGWYGLNRTLIINGAVVRPDDKKKYTDTRGSTSYTLTIHITDITDQGEYRCSNGFDQSQVVRLNFECKASSALKSVTNGKKLVITVEKLYPSSPSFNTSFTKENTDVMIPGSRTCSSSTQYSGFYRCVWSSSNSLGDGSYMYRITVTTITQANPFMGNFKIVTPQPPVILNSTEFNDSRVIVYRNESQLLTIQCISTGGYPTPTVVWYKDSVSSSNQLASTSTGTLQNDGTYTVTLQHRLTPTLADNNRKLICRSYYPHADSAFKRSQTNSVFLFVVHAAKIQSFFIEGYLGQRTVHIGEHEAKLQFKCIIDSKPAASIKIIFKSRVLKEEIHKDSLTFTRRDIGCFDAGTYVCEGKNEYGVTSDNVTVLVNCSPRPLQQIQRNVTAELNKPLTLSFTVLAYPEPDPKGFSWNKEEVEGWIPLLSNVDFQISSSGLQSNLTLLNVSEVDFGHYRVSVTNAVGTYEQHFFVLSNDVQPKDTETSRKQCDNTLLIVAVTLGVLCGVLAMYATFITFRYRRVTGGKGKRSHESTSKPGIYSNPVFTSSNTGHQNDTPDGSCYDKEAATSQYSELSRYENAIRDTYDVIKNN